MQLYIYILVYLAIFCQQFCTIYICIEYMLPRIGGYKSVGYIFIVIGYILPTIRVYMYKLKGACAPFGCKVKNTFLYWLYTANNWGKKFQLHIYINKIWYWLYSAKKNCTIYTCIGYMLPTIGGYRSVGYKYWYCIYSANNWGMYVRYIYWYRIYSANN